MYQSAKISEDRNLQPAAMRAGSMLAGMRSAFLKAGALTLAGGLLPLLFVEAVPQKFEAETRLQIDAASESAVSDAVAALRSKASLDNLIRALNLGRGSEFSVDRPSAAQVMSDIVSGEETTVAQAESRLRDRLSQAIAATYDRRTGQLAISATASEPDMAARVANMVGDSFHDRIAAAGAGTFDPLVEKLRQTLERAEAALSGFIGETGEQKLSELRRAENEGRQLAAEIADAEAQLADLKQKAAQASAMKLEDVLNKPLPDSLEYTGLDYQRQRHVEAKLAVDQLSGNLGPRHPQLLAAQAALEAARSDIQTALKQLAASLRQQEGAAAKHLAELKAKQAKKPNDKEIAGSAARLAALEAAADEARRNYLEALHRSEPGTKVPAARVEVLAPAAAESARALGPSLADISGGGALIGFCLGVALAFFTRRKPLPADMADEAESDPADDADLAIDQHWPETLSEQQGAFADDDPVSREPAYNEPQSPSRPRYPAPANDSPLADHIREMLMANRRPIPEADLPPLVAAAISGRFSETPSYTMPRFSHEDSRKAEELEELRREMAELRERVQLYSARRSAARR
ncbi:hypothetical protein [Neorhizobium sp. DT-125]|uniref:hypothetical protein n=1 Tax=Neorhizobium sp. DT-125 TaxID=3396163 RepID=UPI003F1B20A1